MSRKFPLVIIESPYAGDIAANLTYLRAAMRDSLMRGEAPFASHALYTQPGVADDTDRHERVLGIAAGLSWARHATKTIVYADRGISVGVEQGIMHAHASGRAVDFRSLNVHGPAREVSLGDRVFFIDPDNGISSGFYIVSRLGGPDVEPEEFGDTGIFELQNDAGSEIEALRHEFAHADPPQVTFEVAS